MSIRVFQHALIGYDAPNDTLVTEEWYRFAPPALTSVDTELQSIYNGPCFRTSLVVAV